MTHPCRKVRYRDELAARIALASAARAHDGKAKTERRSYRCPQCHCWHLTSQTGPDPAMED